ncbi:MAG: Arm DNA-binding domain-containing protein, partial [Lysobacterales bacterium]
MPHLTDAAIKRAVPQSKTRRLFDTRGLYLEVTPKGRKYWRFRYKFGQKEKRLSLGIYPEVTLKNARSERDAMREALEGGRDPSQLRKLDKLAGELAAERSFGNLTEHWRAKVRARMAASSLARDMRLLEVDILPLLKDRP